MTSRNKAGMRHKHDQATEQAAAKIRRVAEIPEQADLTEHEKSQADTDITEAHAELERPKHYRGNPPTGSG